MFVCDEVETETKIKLKPELSIIEFEPKMVKFEPKMGKFEPKMVKFEPKMVKFEPKMEFYSIFVGQNLLWKTFVCM